MTTSDTWNEGTLVDARASLIIGADGNLEAIKREQEIPAWFLDEIRAIKDVQDSKRLGNFALAARIPTVVVEKWMREGFNIFDKNIGVSEIIQRLQSLDMDRLIATSKRL
jgi:hypothetical protein